LPSLLWPPSWIYFDTIGLFDPKNSGLGTKIKFLAILEAKILTETFYGSHFEKNPRRRP